MITINGQKMSKSLGNFITIPQLLNGDHETLSRPYSPMTVRFFILQAHYRSTLDFSDASLEAAAKGYKKLINGLRILKKMEYPSNADTTAIDPKAEAQIHQFCDNTLRGMNNDLNTALAIGQLFNLNKKINAFYNNPDSITSISKDAFERMKLLYISFVEDILGLQEEKPKDSEALIEAMLQLYKQAKELKDYEKVDEIRGFFKQNQLIIKDLKHLIDWAYEE
jgi:cysteinyl-tRNA synthetase